jgi:hypothetical protein
MMRYPPADRIIMFCVVGLFAWMVVGLPIFNNSSTLMWIEFHKTLVTAASSILTPFVVLGVTLFFGQRLTGLWNVRVKERETDLSSIRRVHELYGEYLSTMRLWNNWFSVNKPNKSSALDPDALKILDRACVAEGEVEGILMKITSERKLTKAEIDELGLVRQGYQQLRESIDKREEVSWGSSEHAQYVALKKGSQSMINVLYRERELAPLGQFEKITSNDYEVLWRSKG